MLRLLKFLAVFLIGVGIIFILVVYPNRDAFMVVFENGDGLADGSEWAMQATSIKGVGEYVKSNPDLVAYASIDLSNPDSSIFLNADKAVTMGSLSGLLITKALFEQHQKELDLFLNQKVEWSDIDKWVLPSVYAVSHKSAYSYFEEKELFDNTESVTIQQLAQALFVYNDPAIHDYFYSILDDSLKTNLGKHFGLNNTDTIIPLSSIYMTINPNINGLAYQELKESLENDSTYLVSKALQYYDNYNTDTDFRAKVKAETKQSGKGIDFLQEKDLLQYLPQTTANDLVQFMIGLKQDSSNSAKELLNTLDWTRLQQNRLDHYFQNLYAFYDSRIGLSSGVDYGKVRSNGKEFVQAFFFNQVHVAFWFHLNSDLINQDFQQRLMWDKELRTFMR